MLVRINKTNLPLFTAIGERIAIDAELTKVAARDHPVDRAACVHEPHGQIGYVSFGCLRARPRVHASVSDARSRRW